MVIPLPASAEREREDERVSSLWNKLLRVAIVDFRQKPEDAEDLVEDLFESVIKLHRENPEEIWSLPDQYYLKALKSKSINRSKSGRLNHEFLLNDPEKFPEASEDFTEEMLDRDEKRQYVRDLIKSLPKKQQRVLYMVYRGGMTLSEAAGVLGLTESAVSSSLSRAKATLRKKIEGRKNSE